MTIRAEVIADSISPQQIRLTTLQLRYPKFIHGELMTHRVFSRNASSSRAIPVERLIKDVIDDPVYPMHWGKNQQGMSAKEELGQYHQDMVRVAWDRTRREVVEQASYMAGHGAHKQIVNRLLEPFCHINVVVSATDWTNFFALRCHPNAQPEMRLLAEAIRDARGKSQVVCLEPGQWHLPYVNEAAVCYPGNEEQAIKVSVARCARVSYLTHGGKRPDVEDDLALYDRLIGSKPLHASPAEHQATPDEFGLEVIPAWKLEHGPMFKHPEWHGNFRGWIQYRKMLPGESQ